MESRPLTLLEPRRPSTRLVLGVLPISATITSSNNSLTVSRRFFKFSLHPYQHPFHSSYITHYLCALYAALYYCTLPVRAHLRTFPWFSPRSAPTGPFPSSRTTSRTTPSPSSDTVPRDTDRDSTPATTESTSSLVSARTALPGRRLSRTDGYVNLVLYTITTGC